MGVRNVSDDAIFNRLYSPLICVQEKYNDTSKAENDISKAQESSD
jgi:hypothetical protein